MDGYSVQEAATVLGVAEVRVWELLARGVISGTPEGDSMRVFLKAAAAPSPAPAPRDEPPRTNGNGASHGNGGELSAFREVLTEFRNLTERYGQALLALGEARGEVAGLRSRVELLEARLDLRLPTARDDSPIAWGASAPSTPTPEPAVPASVEAVMPAPAPVRRGPRPRPRKARSKKIAMTGFADALARAQDPSVAGVGDALPSEELAAEPFEDVAAEQVAELATEPIADVVVEPIAAFDTEPIADLATEPIADVAAETETPERSSEMEMEEDASPDVRDEAAEVAEAEPESDAAVPTYSAAVVEPDWFADGDFAWLDAADIEARGQPEPSAVPATTEVAVTQADADLEQESTTVAREEAEAAVVPTFTPESVISTEAQADLDTAADLAPEPVMLAEAEAAVAPAPEDLAPAQVIAAEDEAKVLPASDADAERQPEPMTVAAVEADAEAETEASPAPEDPEPEIEIDAPAALEAQPVLDQEDVVDPEPDVEPELMADEEPNPVNAVDSESVEAELLSSHENADPMDPVEPESAPGAAEPGPIALRQRDPAPEFRSPSGEEEMMWIGDDREAASETQAGSRTLPVGPARWETAATDESWPAADSASKTADSTRPPLAMTEDELAQLARDEGWNDAEVAAIRAMIWRPGSPTAGLPGGEELDEAMAALDAVPVEATDDPGASREWAKSPRSEHQPPPAEDWTFELEPSLDDLPPPRTVPRRPGPDPSRARRRKSPAATAYRRLRRFFPS